MRDSKKTKDQLIKELIELRQRITKLEGSEIEPNLSEVFDALEKISLGDPTVRIEETSEIAFISKLKHMVNLTAENMGEIVNLSHEFAMVLAELFDVMHKVSGGNFNARVSGSSQIELLESLKELTNDMIGSISREITERKQMENILKEKEERYRELFETVTDAVLVHYVSHEKPGKFIAANESACKMFGYTADEFLQMEIKDIDIPEQAIKIPVILEKLFKDGHTLFETEHVTKDRRRIPVEVNIRLFDFRGQPAVLSVIRDITERKQTEKALKEREALLQLQFSRMPIGCITWDIKFCVVSWNPAAQNIFGFTEEEAKGKHPYDLIVPKDAQLQVDTIWQRLLEGDITAHSENENITKDGHIISCYWVNTPLKYADGKVIGVISMVQDITERKQAEEESKKRVKELEDFYEMAVSRELRMIDLKNQITEFKERLEKYERPED